jgi:hypothetical protein
MFNPLVFMSYVLAIIIVVFAILNFLSQKENKEQPENRPILIHFEPQLSGGHMLGVVKNKEESENRVKIEFLPRDLNLPKETKNGKIKEKSYTLFFNKNQFDDYAGWSSHVPIYMAFPDNKDKLPEGILKNFPEVAMRIERNNREKMSENLYKINAESILKTSKNLASGESIQRKIKELEKEYIRDLIPFKENKKDEK